MCATGIDTTTVAASMVAHKVGSYKMRVRFLTKTVALRWRRERQRTRHASRPRPTRLLAFVLVERRLRPLVRLFAPLRDKVTAVEVARVSQPSEWQKRFHGWPTFRSADFPDIRGTPHILLSGVFVRATVFVRNRTRIL